MTACQPPPAPQPVDEQERAARIDTVLARPCDTPGFRDFADEVVRSIRSEEEAREFAGVLVSAPDLNNSQLHDCQRLARGDTLGPLVGLLVNQARVESTDFSGGVVVADIVNYHGAPYDPLRIPPNRISCLWIRGPGGPGGAWTAAILEPPRGTCPAAAPDTAPARPLEVRRLQITGSDPDYPPTGRWMWDHDRQEQFIGIRCGDGWCEIGRQGFIGTNTLATSGDVPGWWDEQFLAYAPTPGAPLERSDLWGRIVPGDSNRAVEA